MNKAIKLLLILLILIIIVGIGLLVYTAYQEQQGNETFISGVFPSFSNNLNNNQVGGDDDIIILPDSGSNQGGSENNTPRAQIFQITQAQIAGYTIIPGANEVVRYMEKGTGNIYDYNLTNGNQNKISNKTIERVQKVIWGEGGNEFITIQITEEGSIANTYFSFSPSNQSTFFFEKTLNPNDNNESVRDLQKALNKDPETMIATNGVGSPGQESTFYGAKTTDAVKRFQEKYSDDIGGVDAVGVFDNKTQEKLNSLFNKSEGAIAQEINLFEKPLPQSISRITASPNKKQIFYFIDNDEVSLSGTVANFNNTQQKIIFDIPFTDWNILWQEEDTILLTTKASKDVLGATYSLNTGTGALNRVLGDINGLTTNPNSDGSLILYSQTQTQGSGISTHVLNTSTGNQGVITLKTLPEKCVWSVENKDTLYCGVPKSFPVGIYPDDWYKGVANFSDVVWEYNATTRLQNIIIDLETQTLGGTVDVSYPSLSSGDEVLIFIDKNNSSLWGLSLN